ncbi:hypothetical protein L615_002400000090 [Nocardioides sp. J9]|uniref:hypothetical protein n=1 Tax=Nocardioides sp. J9 TaxID=935844 RepID=UPI00119E6FC5|nr:hypothetical protein [Nocardioides sp. J9]TWG99763.1 hypothetical protein L615_002400000090 [Nocardioides sp. J9]
MRRTRRPNPNARRRMVLLVAGALPALVVAAYLLKVALMLQHNAAGRDAFDRGDYDGAAAEFFETRDLNWFEPWVAPFGQGASLHADGLLDDAVAAYGTALEDVPERDECTVRINLSLAHEAIGDARQGEGDLDGATAAYQEGIDVLAAGECPTDAGRGEEQAEDAEDVDERLREKLRQAEEQQQQQGGGDQGQEPEEQQGERPDQGGDPRQDRLERNNELGREQRSEEQDLFRDEDYTRPETW